MRARFLLLPLLAIALFAAAAGSVAAATDVFQEVRKSLMASGDQEALQALTVLERRPIFPALGKAVMQDPGVRKAFQAYMASGQQDAQLKALSTVVQAKIRDLLAQSGDTAAQQAAAVLAKSPAFQKAVADAFRAAAKSMRM